MPATIHGEGWTWEFGPFVTSGPDSFVFCASTRPLTPLGTQTHDLAADLTLNLVFMQTFHVFILSQSRAQDSQAPKYLKDFKYCYTTTHRFKYELKKYQNGSPTFGRPAGPW